MLQLIFITTNTGVPKFKKSLITDLDRDIFLRLSNLIVTLFVKSKREIDYKLNHFELSNRAVTIVENINSKLLCILMHDLSDGYEFGKLVAEEILERFISTFRPSTSLSTKALYSNSFKNKSQVLHEASNIEKSNNNNNTNNNTGGVGNTEQEFLENHRHLEDLTNGNDDSIELDFNGVNVDEKIFEAKLAEIYLDLVYPIIEELDSVRGIQHSWLIESGDEGILTTTKPQLEADLKFLVNNCDRLLNGVMQTLTIKGTGKNIQIVTVEHKCHLVVLIEANVHPEITSRAIHKAVFLLKKVYALRKNIKVQ
ncbi:hypothetical protein ABK040_001001 [Willaertia magna]